MEDILIIGSSGQAKVVIDIIEAQKKYRIAGLVDSFREIGHRALGYPVLGAEADLPELLSTLGCNSIFIAVGDNFLRARVAANLRNTIPGIALITAAHPSATIARSATLEEGCAVMAGAVVGPDCIVGKCCILNTNSSLDHESVMHQFSSLAPNCATGGNCTIGEYAAVGIGASIAHNVSIGPHTIIGAGATVLNDVEAYSVAYGVPAKIVRKRLEGEPYL